MKRILAAIALTLVAPVAASAQDAPRVYANLSLEIVNLNSFDTDGTPNLFGDNTSSASGRLGVVVQRHIAIEGEYGQGLDNNADDGVAGYDNRFAGFIRPRLPITSGGRDTGGEVFLRLGYGSTAVDSSSVGGLDDLSGIAFGFGAQYAFGADDRFFLRADWTRYNFGENSLNTGDGLYATLLSVGGGVQF